MKLSLPPFVLAHKKAIGLVLKLAVTALLFWLLLRSIDMAALGAVLATASLPAIAAGFALALVQVVLVAARWITFMRLIGGRLALWPAFAITYIGGFFNQALPSSAGGDVFRVYLASRQPGLSLQKAFRSVMLERVLNVIGLVLLAVVALAVMVRAPGGEALAALAPVLALLTLGCVFGTVTLMLLDKLPPALMRFRIVRAFGALSADARALFLRPANLVAPGVTTVVSLLEYCLILYVLALGLHIDVSFIEGMAIFSLVLLATALPVSIGGWGVREGAMVGLLGMIGVPAEPALALSVLYGIIALVGTLPGGLIWLAYGYSKSDIEEAKQAVAEAA